MPRLTAHGELAIVREALAGVGSRSQRSSGQRRGRVGAALLEALVAITILATAGVAMVALADESLRAIDRARSGEIALRHANAFLEPVALWPREDLDRHLGRRPEGPWLLEVERALPTLYIVTLTDSTDRTGAHPLLATALYRPEATREAP
jgi:hypothetical protein